MPKAKPLVKVPTPAVDPSIKSLKDKLYDACVAKHTGQYISQNQLLALKIIPNDNIHNLTACVNLLLNEHLLTLLLDDGVYIYRVNRREDGHRLAGSFSSKSQLWMLILSSQDTSNFQWRSPSCSLALSPQGAPDYGLELSRLGRIFIRLSWPAASRYWSRRE